MRWALAMLLVSAAVAGCTGGDDPNPPNADPFPNEPHPSRVPTSTPPSTATHTNPPPTNTTATGSSTSPAAPRGDPFGAHSQEDSDSDPAFSGLMYAGQLTGSGARVRVEAAANNAGERTFRVTDGCQPPWSESMAGPSGSVLLREPVPTCAGYSWRDFPAHDYLSKSYEWNGTLWDASAGRYVPAPPGTYTWTIAFDVYGGSGEPPEDHAELTLEFQVTVR